MALEISPMTQAELSMVLGWAAEEGWNPGLDDTQAFFLADPNGFLLGRLEGEPVSAISVVRHSDEIGFLGLYLCRPEFRGMGYGMEVWQAGLEYLGDRSVGLDGVVDQQSNYKKSGFKLQHRTIRYQGKVKGAASSNVRVYPADSFQDMHALDEDIVGYQRPAYVRAWLSDAPTRKTLIYATDGQLAGFGTIRTCQKGHKIGPLFARNPEIAQELLTALAHYANADEIVLDVPDHNSKATDMARSLGMVPVFETARMFNGQPPVQRKDWIFGETTLELG